MSSGMFHEEAGMTDGLGGRLPIPPFGALRAFEAYGRAGGVRRAAEVLGVSHTIVSRHLRALEEWIGVVLIDRSTGTLTESGRTYHQDITQALRSLSRASAQFRPRNEKFVRVTCVPGLAQAWLISRLGAFREKYKLQELVVRPYEKLPDFDRDGIMADIRYFRPNDLNRLSDDIMKLEMARPAMFPVASPDVAAKINQRIRGAADLMKEPLLEAEDSQEWVNFFLWHQVDSPVFQRIGSLGHASLTLAAAKHGQGVALANVYLVYDELKAGSLVPIVAPDIRLDQVTLGGYFLVGPATHWRQPAFIAFRNWLIQEVRDFNRDCMAFLETSGFRSEQKDTGCFVKNM